MTVASALVLGAGLISLLAAGPALDNLHVSVIWASIAALQTLAAITFATVALRENRQTQCS